MKKRLNFNKDTIPDLLYRRAQYTPNDIVYSFPEFNQEYSWSEVWLKAQKIAEGFLQVGVKKGDRIALLMRGRAELILCMYASACIGAIAVPLNTYSKKDELIAYLHDSKPKLLIMDTEGQHQNYLTIFEEILSELNDDASAGMLSKIFVLEEKNKVKTPFYSFLDITKKGSYLKMKPFLSACQSVKKDDPFIIFYTSGTLGQPKAVVRTTASFLTSNANGNIGQRKVNSLIARLGDYITKHFSIMNLLPLYHLGGFSTIFITLKACNMRITMLSHYNPTNAITVIKDNKCRFLVGTPYMIQQILTSLKQKQFDLNSLIGLIFTSSPVNKSIIKRVTNELNLLFFIVGYGSTEAGAVANGTCFLNQRRLSVTSLLYKVLKHTKLLSGLIKIEQFENCPYSLAGRVDKNVEVQIADPKTGEKLPLNSPGEICIRSHRVMRYKDVGRNQSSFSGEGWFKSGDLGFMNEDGLLIITGRLKRIISRGGEKISPVEVENALLTFKEVDSAYVVGIPDGIYGEELCAFIIPEKSTRLTSKDIQNKMATQISNFKIPKYILFLSHFPISPTGKVSQISMQQLALEQLKECKINA